MAQRIQGCLTRPGKRCVNSDPTVSLSLSLKYDDLLTRLDAHLN